MNRTIINSFDGTETIFGFIERPEKYNHLFQAVKSSSGCIARGAGLSYCAAGSGNEITSIDMTKFNRILMFDETNGTIKVESGLSVGDFISFIVKRGWYFNVIPGYPSITIGGCVAFNVHGKSQYNIGTFGDHIKEITIFHPDYGEIICSKSANTDVFDLTIGGFGLTGVILSVTIVLSRLQGNIVLRQKVKCRNLSEAVEKMFSSKNEYENVYSWNNLNISGKNFGRGIIYLEKFHQGTLTQFNEYNYTRFNTDFSKKTGINFINHFTAELICYLYYSKEFISPSFATIRIADSTFPIYGKEIYYYLFGSQGFREYQLIVPFTAADELFSGVQNLIKKFGIPVTLGSLKIFKGENKYLSFCKDGVCLAIDVPATAKSQTFFSEMDNLAMRINGIANISKDSRLNARTINGMYSQYGKFRSELLKYDPGKYFTSSLRERIEV